MQTDVYILGGARTPMGEYNGKLKDLSAIDLGAIRYLTKGADPEAINDAIEEVVAEATPGALMGTSARFERPST